MTKIEFEIVRIAGGFRLIADGSSVAMFSTIDGAADVAVRFAQDSGAFYSIFYPL